MIIKRDELHHRYIIGEFFLDLAAAFPLGYVLMIFQAPDIYIATLGVLIYYIQRIFNFIVVKIARLIKVRKVMKLVIYYKENADFNIPFFRLVIIGVFLVFFAHIAACIMYKITEIEYYNEIGTNNTCFVTLIGYKLKLIDLLV